MNNLLKKISIYSLLLFVITLSLSAQQEFNYGIATQSVINLRLSPAFAAEMGTQALMGTPVRILETVHGWSNVVTPDGYKAWTTEESIKKMNPVDCAAWNAAPKVIVNTLFTIVRSRPSANAPVVSDVVWGDILRYQGINAKYVKVMLPDGRKGYLLKQSTLFFKKWEARATPTAARIIATAKCFIGFPYLWGGTSVKGMDCSGFTKTCFFLNGVILPRDASQQAQTGENVDITKNLDALKPADLLFFGSMKENKQHVSHVGIYIGNGEFIHSSGTVHISSLIPGSLNFDSFNTHRLLRAQRLLTRIDLDSSIVSVKNHPYYKLQVGSR
jgi:gamma-D-glutamyl-L-lysine dipeptidyl-peptidase